MVLATWSEQRRRKRNIQRRYSEATSEICLLYSHLDGACLFLRFALGPDTLHALRQKEYPTVGFVRPRNVQDSWKYTYIHLISHCVAVVQKTVELRKRATFSAKALLQMPTVLVQLFHPN